METIERAAIRTNEGTVYSVWRPQRHHDLLAFLRARKVPIPAIQNQGFITSTGRIVSRSEAAQVEGAAQTHATAPPVPTDPALHVQGIAAPV